MESRYKSQLKSIVLSLRHILEGRYDGEGNWHPGDLEERLAALGVRRERESLPMEALSHLSAEDQRVRQIVDAFIQTHLKSGRSRKEAVCGFVQESAHTWANRLIALRCMEARELIDEVILQKENYGGRSLKHHRLARQNPDACAGEDDGLYAVLLAEFADRAQELPLVFHPDEPVIALRPGVAALKQCIRLLSAPDDIFIAADALGWAYQYWNTEEKDRVFEKVRTVKGAKIEKGDIIPVTQLYTEPYMVKFLVQNSLGALWMAMHPGSRLCESWEYYVRDADRAPVERKPLKQIAFLDPCVGSGHFLLTAFDLLYAMYQEEGELTTPAEICDAILSRNLYGIDIDERSIQIAALALYMKAGEKAPDFRPSRINLVASNIRPAAESDHLSGFLFKHPEDKPLLSPLQLIFENLDHADELGSLLQIEEPVEKEFRFLKARDDESQSKRPKQVPIFQQMEKPEQQKLPLGVVSYEAWKADLLARLKSHFEEEFASMDFSTRFFGKTAGKGLSLFDFLSRRYDVVATNPPYMGSKNMGAVVKRYVGKHFSRGKRDLYAAFILRCVELARPETGRVAMVTQQSWMFLRSFADLRAMDEEKLKKVAGFKGILRETSVETLAHLGPGAFGEISGEVVNIVLFTLAKTPPQAEHRLTAFRLIGPKRPEEKETLLKKVNIAYHQNQNDYLGIVESPIIYWLSSKYFTILKSRCKVGDLADVRRGLDSGNDYRFVHFWWEVNKPGWVSYSKGGGYSKWGGFNYYVLDWRNGNVRYCETPGARIQNIQYYFKPFITYSLMAQGSFGGRIIDAGTIPGGAAGGIYLHDESKTFSLAAYLNTRPTSFLLRCLSPELKFREGYVFNTPLPANTSHESILNTLVDFSLKIKTFLINSDIRDRTFQSNKGLFNFNLLCFDSLLLLAEGVIEQIVANSHDLNTNEIRELVIETGTPADWVPLIEGYDTLPPLPQDLPDIPPEVLEYLQIHDRRALQSSEVDALKSLLRILYEVGPGGKKEPDEAEVDAENDEDEQNDQLVVDARIPIPAETFLEELSQKLEVHPISVYWLLKEGIEQEGWRCRPEEQRLIKDRFTVLILRLLGHRWPKQIESGDPVPAWADDDGVIPLTEGAEELTLYQRLRERLAADYGDERVSSEENAFEDVMGKPLQEWVRKDFFRQHISRFKKRPIAWHLSSARWTSRPRQEAAFEGIVYYHKTDGDLLPKLRSQYVGPLAKRLGIELHGLENGGGLTGEQEIRKTLLQDRLPELKAFDKVLSDVIADGFGPESMKSMLRQYAVNDAMLCLKARWLMKLSKVIQDGPLADWQQQAKQTGLHTDFSDWITAAMTHLDHHCAVVGPKPPEEKSLDADPTAIELAEIICAKAEVMLTHSLKCACTVWWKSFDVTVLKPISVKIRAARKELQSLKAQSLDPKRHFDKQTDITRKMNALKSDIKVWRDELALKTGQGKAVREAIESWPCPDALTWESWLAKQEMYDQLSSLNAKRPPPKTVREFMQQESLYQPDINDGVRVNIAPLQKAGLLTKNVLAGKDMEKAISDRAAWRDDERRWCREGKLPKPGWWE